MLLMFSFMSTSALASKLDENAANRSLMKHGFSKIATQTLTFEDKLNLLLILSDDSISIEEEISVINGNIDKHGYFTPINEPNYQERTKLKRTIVSIGIESHGALQYVNYYITSEWLVGPFIKGTDDIAISWETSNFLLQDNSFNHKNFTFNDSLSKYILHSETTSLATAWQKGLDFAFNLPNYKNYGYTTFTLVSTGDIVDSIPKIAFTYRHNTYRSVFMVGFVLFVIFTYFLFRWFNK